MQKKLKNMLISSKVLQKLNNLLKNKNVLDVIIFGSSVKGKPNPTDIDICVILKEKENISFDDENMHLSILELKDIFIKPISLVNTLLREGISLRHKKPFSELFKFNSKVMFIYKLNRLSNSKKVKIVNILRGKKGLVHKSKGKFLSNQIFVVDILNDNLFENFFQLHGVEYKKYYLLMH